MAQAFSEGRQVIHRKPSASINNDNIGKVKEALLENCRVDNRKIAKDLNTAYGSTVHILVNILYVKRINVRFVPEDLSPLRKRRLVVVAKEMVHNVTEDSTFIKRIIICEKTCVYGYDVEIA